MKSQYEHTQVLSQVGLNVSRLRTERGISQTMLAYLAGVDRSHLNQVENGNNNASVIFLAKLADGLGVSMTCFFEGLETLPPCELFLEENAEHAATEEAKAIEAIREIDTIAGIEGAEEVEKALKVSELANQDEVPTEIDYESIHLDVDNEEQH